MNNDINWWFSESRERISFVLGKIKGQLEASIKCQPYLNGEHSNYFLMIQFWWHNKIINKCF